MSKKNDYQISAPLTSEQLVRVGALLVDELSALRAQALARRADSAAVSEVFRRRAERLAAETATTRVPRPSSASTDAIPSCIAPAGRYRSASGVSVFPPDGEYSVWW
jgi:hypothetical protein